MGKIVNEFKEFALKGNVIDLAVGVIIGGAFQKIVTSLVGDLVMPILGIIVGKNIFQFLNFSITPYGSTVPVEIRLGSFLQTSFDFILMAIAIFFLVKGLNTLRRLSDLKLNLKVLNKFKKEEVKQVGDSDNGEQG